MSTIRVSILSPYEPNKPDSLAYMGKLARTVDAPGERLLSALVSDPAVAVAAITNDDTWLAREPAIVAALAAAPDKPTRNEIKKKIPALVPARFMGERRVSEECLGRQVIGHDFDAVVAETFEEACAKVREQLQGRFLAVHTTATERNRGDADGRPAGTWCLRGYELLDREATPAEWEARVKPHMRSVGEHDVNSLDVVHLLFCPVSTAGYRFCVYEGPRTRLDDLAAVALAKAPAPRPTPPRVAPAVVSPSAGLTSTEAEAAHALGRSWPPNEKRRPAHLALCGALWHAGWPEEKTLEFLRATYAAIGEPNEEGHASVISSTYKHDRADTTVKVTGWPALAQHVPAMLVDAVRKKLSGMDVWEAKRADVEVRRGATEAPTPSVSPGVSLPAPPQTARLTPAQRATRMVGRDVTRLRTGLPSLDAATRGGILLRKVVVIGGAPGAGKTALLVRLAYSWLTQGVPVGILASDEDADGLLTRLGQLHGLSRDAIERGDPAACSALAAWCESVPLILADGDEDAGSVESLSRDLRALANGRPSGLLVDSIQTARSELQVPTGTDARAKIDAMVRALKFAAKVDGHVVAASSELARGAYRNKDQSENTNPLAAFKESGAIEYGVSLGVVLSSRQGSSELVDGEVVKNRLGPGKPKFVLRLDHDRADVRETTEQDAKAVDPLFLVKDKIKAALDVACGAPLSKRQLAERVGGRTSIAFRAIDALLDAHELHQEVRGIRFPLPGDPGYVERITS